jgi:hypothetical protein
MHAWRLQVQKYPSYFDDGSLYEEANFCPCSSHAQSQLPHFKLPCRPPTVPFFPSQSTHANIYY